jgi:hypothetical protein
MEEVVWIMVIARVGINIMIVLGMDNCNLCYLFLVKGCKLFYLLFYF